jgi:hypothetical protein
MTENADPSSTPGEPATSLAAIPDFSPDERYLLQLAQQFLQGAGFYSYLMIDDEQRWVAAADDEAGRVDVRLDGAAYQIEVCSSSPGLFMEEESEWRRTALERLARRVVPNVARGMLGEHESAFWSEEDRGVAVCITRHLPLDKAQQVPLVVRQGLDQLEELLTRVESELRT